MNIQSTLIDENIVRTADIVSAYVSNNVVEADSVGDLIRSVHQALGDLGSTESEERPEPAVPIGKSIKPDYIVCLEDGKKLKMLKRYLRTHYDLSPEEYRAKWDLPPDYPLVSPNYSERRRELAKDIGLGTVGNPRRGRKKTT